MKAKITTNAGTFEFEGDDQAVEKQIAAVLSISATMPTLQSTAESTTPAAKKRSAGARRATTQPKMLATLLTSKDEIDSLREYFDLKKPSSQVEVFAVLTLWLKNNKDLPDASIDEMWTLYKVLNIKQPKNLMQTFRDGKSKKSYFESADNGRYFITSFGETFVDHDLPAAVTTKGGK